jgi:hypothetical protein
MIEEPPHLQTPEIQYRIFNPYEQVQEQIMVQRRIIQLCKACRNRKVKCDVNLPFSEICPRKNCRCLYHITWEEQYLTKLRLLGPTQQVAQNLDGV